MVVLQSLSKLRMEKEIELFDLKTVSVLIYGLTTPWQGRV
jgi:hypothetical protein